MFKKKIKDKSLYYDPTGLLEEVVKEGSSKIKFILLPPYSDESLVFDMMGCFFGIENKFSENKNLFSELSIKNNRLFFNENYGKYQVIYFRVNSHKKYHLFLDSMLQRIYALYEYHNVFVKNIEEVSKIKEYYKLLSLDYRELSEKQKEHIIIDSFKEIIYFLSEYTDGNHTKNRLMLLIENYDNNILLHYGSKDSNKIEKFLSNFYKKILFDTSVQNTYDFCALLGSIELPGLRLDLLLNKAKIYHLFDNEIGRYFGFPHHVIENILLSFKVKDISLYMDLLKENFSIFTSYGLMYDPAIVECLIIRLQDCCWDNSFRVDNNLFKEWFTTSFIFEPFKNTLITSNLDFLLNEFNKNMEHIGTISRYLNKLKIPQLVEYELRDVLYPLQRNYQDESWFIKFLWRFGVIDAKKIENKKLKKTGYCLQFANNFVKFRFKEFIYKYSFSKGNYEDLSTYMLFPLAFPSQINALLAGLMKGDLDELMLVSFFETSTLPSLLYNILLKNNTISSLVQRINSLGDIKKINAPLLVELSKENKVAMHPSLHRVVQDYIVNQLPEMQLTNLFHRLLDSLSQYLELNHRTNTSKISQTSKLIAPIGDSLFWMSQIAIARSLESSILDKINNIYIEIVKYIFYFKENNDFLFNFLSFYEIECLLFNLKDDSYYMSHQHKSILYRLSGDFKALDISTSGCYVNRSSKYCYQYALKIIKGYNINELNIDQIYLLLRIKLIKYTNALAKNKLNKSEYFRFKIGQYLMENEDSIISIITPFDNENSLFYQHDLSHNVLFLLLDASQIFYHTTNLYRCISKIFLISNIKISDKKNWMCMEKLNLYKSHKMDALIDRSKSMGFISNPKGVCHGIAHIGKQFILTSNVNLFDSIFTQICLTPLCTFSIEMKERGRRFSNFPHLGEPKKECAIFLQCIELAQQGQFYPEFFPQKMIPKKQIDMDLHPLIFSNAIESMGGMLEFACFDGIHLENTFGKTSFKHYCLELMEYMVFSEPVALVLDSRQLQHTITIGYIPSEATWFLINSGTSKRFRVKDFSQCSSTLAEVFSDALIKAFFNYPVIYFKTIIYVTQSTYKTHFSYHKDFAAWTKNHSIEHYNFDELLLVIRKTNAEKMFSLSFLFAELAITYKVLHSEANKKVKFYSKDNSFSFFSEYIKHKDEVIGCKALYQVILNKATMESLSEWLPLFNRNINLFILYKTLWLYVNASEHPCTKRQSLDKTGYK